MERHISHYINTFNSFYGSELLKVSDNLGIMHDFYAGNLSVSKLTDKMMVHFSWLSSNRKDRHQDGMYYLYFTYKGAPVIGTFIRNEAITRVFMFGTPGENSKDSQELIYSKDYSYEDHVSMHHDAKQIDEVIRKCFSPFLKKYALRLKIKQNNDAAAQMELEKQKTQRENRRKQFFNQFLNDKELTL